MNLEGEGHHLTQYSYLILHFSRQQGETIPCWLEEVSFQLLRRLMREPQSKKSQATSRSWELLAPNCKPTRKWGPPFYNHRKMDSANNLSLEEDQVPEMNVPNWHLDCSLLWDPEQNTQLNHAKTPTPWKSRDNKLSYSKPHYLW